MGVYRIDVGGLLLRVAAEDAQSAEDRVRACVSPETPVRCVGMTSRWNLITLDRMEAADEWHDAEPERLPET